MSHILPAHIISVFPTLSLYNIYFYKNICRKLRGREKSCECLNVLNVTKSCVLIKGAL